eukprot:GHVS01035313.1.p1 GENE.GHVS01035313.1~~GHVS01035313.1.p1  ORF type:complete len:564 (+),score=135.03 GHVS01035313.1:193-1692(+)
MEEELTNPTTTTPSKNIGVSPPSLFFLFACSLLVIFLVSLHYLFSSKTSFCCKKNNAASGGGGGGRRPACLLSGFLFRLFSLLSHPSELVAYLTYFLHSSPAAPNTADPHERFCYRMLQLTSRSFCAVIMELHEELRLSVVVFYLTLRALDTIEDDTTIAWEVKETEMRLFASRLDDRPGGVGEEWNGKGLGIGKGLFISDSTTNQNEVELLEQFDKVISVFRTLKPQYRDCIQTVTAKMSSGMLKYLQKEVNTLADYDEYCYYVAGLVGHGLTGLIRSSQLEGDRLLGDQPQQLANSMGLFLQKTNITRDFHEDTTQATPRVFYPKQIWGKYATTFTSLGDDKNKAMCCLNEMVCNALQHVPDVLAYCSLTRELSVLRFCAIPLLMAIGTLERLYDNEDVLTGVVKIRKGEAVRLIVGCVSFAYVVGVFEQYCHRIEAKWNKRKAATVQQQKKEMAEGGEEEAEDVQMMEKLLVMIFESIAEWKEKAKHITTISQKVK